MKSRRALALGVAIVAGALTTRAVDVTMEQLVTTYWGASVLAYEPFDYPEGVGLDTSCNGGYGFSQPWQPNLPSGGSLSNQLITAGSLYYVDQNGNRVYGIGNKVHITGDGTVDGDNVGGARANAQPRRAFSFSRGSQDETTLVAFLAVRTGLPYLYVDGDGNQIYFGRATSVQLFQGTGSERLTIGRASQNSEPTTILPKDTWALINRGTASYTKPTTVPLTNVPPNSTANFILVRIDHKAGDDRVNAPDTAYIWVNPADILTLPPLSTAMAISLASEGERDYWFDTLRLFAGNYNTTVGYGSADIDEIIVATPEPSVIGLGLAGLAGLVLLRRRV